MKKIMSLNAKKDPFLENLIPNIVGSACETMGSAVPFIALSAIYAHQLSVPEWKGFLASLKKINFAKEFAKMGPANFFATFLMTSGQQRIQTWLEEKKEAGEIPDYVEPKFASVAGTGTFGAIILTAARNAIIASKSPNTRLGLGFLMTGVTINVLRDITWLWAVSSSMESSEEKGLPDKVKDNTISAIISHAPDLVSRWQAGNQVKVGNDSVRLVMKQLKSFPTSILQGLLMRIIMLNCSALAFSEGHKLGQKLVSPTEDPPPPPPHPHDAPVEEVPPPDDHELEEPPSQNQSWWDYFTGSSTTDDAAPTPRMNGIQYWMRAAFVPPVINLEQPDMRDYPVDFSKVITGTLRKIPADTFLPKQLWGYHSGSCTTDHTPDAEPNPPFVEVPKAPEKQPENLSETIEQAREKRTFKDDVKLLGALTQTTQFQRSTRYLLWMLRKAK